MGSRPDHVHFMLRTYGKQLTSARRLARFRRALQLARGQDPEALPREVRRRQLVERVSREIIENLIVEGSENPVVKDIQAELEFEIGSPLVFEYPLDGSDLQILRYTAEGPQAMGPDETNRVMGRLWEITYAKVDETML